MTEAPTSRPPEAPVNRRLALLLAMAMFVLVVDTSLMNVSISAVVHDLDTTLTTTVVHGVGVIDHDPDIDGYAAGRLSAPTHGRV